MSISTGHILLRAGGSGGGARCIQTTRKSGKRSSIVLVPSTSELRSSGQVTLKRQCSKNSVLACGHRIAKAWAAFQ